MTTLYLYDDARARAFEPFALSRPLSELIAGARSIRERWSLALGIPVTGLIAAPHLADFEELDAPPVTTEDIPAGSIVANARAIPALPTSPQTTPDAAGRWEIKGRLAAVRLAQTMRASAFRDGAMQLDTILASDRAGRAVALDGRWIEAPWDLIAQLPSQLTEDIARMIEALDEQPRRTGAPAQTAVIGSHDVRIAPTATVEPYVVLDVTAGPILIDGHATVRAFSRLAGPCYIGRGAMVLGGRIAVASIGDACRVSGELNTTIFLGHSNKAHDGFVGHSYIGRWVNLGAGTTTSNLKNTYGTVQMWTPAGIVDTGQQFLGTLFGDHAKTGIGVCLTTGGMLGTGANVYGGAIPPKVVPPFAWGDTPPYSTFEREKFLAVAERMMGRRQIALTPRARQWLSSVYEHRWAAPAVGA